MKIRLLSVLVAVALSAGCAHTPPVTVNYYFSSSEASVKVIRTVACDDSDHLVVATSVAPTVRYKADRSHQQSLALSKLKGAWSDTDLKIEFYEDGRLKGVNASSTGQGEGILKTAIGLAQFAAAGEDRHEAPKFPTECKLIKSWSPTKPVTITYESQDDLLLGTVGQLQPIPASVDSEFYARQLEAPLGVFCAIIQSRTPPKPPADYPDSRASDAMLRLRQPGRVSIDVKNGPPVNCQMNAVWSGEVLAGQDGIEYPLPIPRAAVFGKQVFAVSLAESGALTSLQYGSNTGAGQVLNVLNAGLAAAQGPTSAQEAAELKAEGDIIANQNRLVQCKAHPETCK